jgi:hypothetical protein
MNFWVFEQDVSANAIPGQALPREWQYWDHHRCRSDLIYITPYVAGAEHDFPKVRVPPAWYLAIPARKPAQSPKHPSKCKGCDGAYFTTQADYSIFNSPNDHLQDFLAKGGTQIIQRLWSSLMACSGSSRCLRHIDKRIHVVFDVAYNITTIFFLASLLCCTVSRTSVRADSTEPALFSINSTRC